MSIKDYHIRCTKKGKTRGRPSKEEITISKIMSYHMEQPEMKEAMRKKLLEIILYGKGG